MRHNKALLPCSRYKIWLESICRRRKSRQQLGSLCTLPTGVEFATV